ncbi:MAG TPA: hypothetical protein VFI22_10910, partial [Thermomicrobiales bacterium]|nr:hypothetical protein [Thermomicrobiales bacterium]
MVNASAGDAARPHATPLGDALAAAVESEQMLAERATRLDAGDLAAAGELAGLLPERLAASVEWLDALEGWTPPRDFAGVRQEAVNALAFQALRWRMVEESLQQALAGEIEAAIERRGAAHGALLDQQQSWQLLGFALQCVAAQRPAAIAALALPIEVRAALGLPDTPPASGATAAEGLAAARLTIAAVPPRQTPASDGPPEARTLSSASGAAAEAALRQLASLEPEPAWLEDARQDYIAIVRRAMGRLVDAGGGAASLLSRLATAIAGRPIDFGAATAAGFGLGHDLLWGTIELDVSLPDVDNGWWMLTDD